jgi:hypothetical protein
MSFCTACPIAESARYNQRKRTAIAARAAG